MNYFPIFFSSVPFSHILSVLTISPSMILYLKFEAYFYWLEFGFSHTNNQKLSPNKKKKSFLREAKKWDLKEAKMRDRWRLWFEEQWRRSSFSFTGFSLRNFNLSFWLVWGISLTYRYNLLLLFKFKLKFFFFVCF